MGWTGKLVGAILGYVLTRRPIGVLIGMILGHLYDQWAARGRADPRVDLAAVRATFFRAAFSIMGHVAKSDGRVSEQDIAAARRIFRQFNLGEADLRAAMELFSQGKQPGFDAEAMLAELAAACRGREAVLRMFLEIQMRAALMADGLGGATRETLVRIAARLGIGAVEFAHLEAFLPTGPRAARAGGRSRADARRSTRPTGSWASLPVRAMRRSSAHTASR